MDPLTITRPDDWHCHLRDNSDMQAVVGYSARQFGRLVVMPNLSPPVTRVSQAMAYRQSIMAETAQYPHFNPQMTLYLTDNTKPEEIAKAAQTEHIIAIKYYPAGATTNSDSGVTDLLKVRECLAVMQKYRLPLLLHGEVTQPDIDIFDREKRFIDDKLTWLIDQFAELPIVLEHITTKQAVDFVTSAGPNVAATITPQHLLLNRNAMLVGGMHPHHYCLPVLKREEHRIALVEAAISGNSKFFLGTDSAPHSRQKKESACGCAGIFSAHAAIELYATAFENSNALDKLEAFASFYGADFYGLPRNQEKITLTQQTWNVPAQIPLEGDILVPFFASKTLHWKYIE